MATRLFGSQTSLREANRANLLASIHKFGMVMDFGELKRIVNEQDRKSVV